MVIRCDKCSHSQSSTFLPRPDADGGLDLIHWNPQQSECLRLAYDLIKQYILKGVGGGGVVVMGGRGIGEEGGWLANQFKTKGSCLLAIVFANKEGVCVCVCVDSEGGGHQFREQTDYLFMQTQVAPSSPSINTLPPPFSLLPLLLSSYLPPLINL